MGIVAVTLLPERAGLAQSLQAGRLSDLASTLFKNILETDFLDIGQNILLFMPLGFLVASPMEDGIRSAPRRILRACLAGFLLSAAVESIQIWIPGRYCSLSDILSNAAGAALGGWMAARLHSTGAEQARNY